MTICFIKKILYFLIFINSLVLSYKPITLINLRNDKKITNYIYNLSNNLTNNNTNCKCIVYGKCNDKIFEFQESFEYNKESSFDIAIHKINQIKYNDIFPTLLFYYIIFEATNMNIYNLIKIIMDNQNINIIVEKKQDEKKIYNYLLTDNYFQKIKNNINLNIYNINDLS